MDTNKFALLFCAIQPLNLIILLLVNKVIKEPYMDEFFHLDQAEQYLQGNFTYWNDKLTTPPGLYIMMWPLLKLNSYFGLCSTLSMARFLNIFLFGNLSFVLNYQMFKYNTRERNAVEEDYSGIALSQFFIPTIFFFHFLFYTDSASLTSMQLAFILIQNNRIKLAALVGALSICIRQTNIVWIFFSCCVFLIRKYNLGSGSIERRVRVVLLKMKHISEEFFLMIVLGVGFLVFAYWNSGIALGDKKNHIPVFHGTQLLYFLWFALHFFPFTLEEYFEYFVETVSLIRRQIFLFILTVTAFSLVAHFFSYAHPFMLADNRHYIFYIWKNFFARFSFFKYEICVLYAFSAFFIYNFLLRNKASADKFFCIKILFFCAFLTLTPAGLIEFRYFTVALTFLNTELRSNNMVPRSQPDKNLKTNFPFERILKSFYTNAFLYFICDCFLFYVFLFKPYECQGEKNCRFMF